MAQRQSREDAVFDFLFPSHAFGSQTLRLVAEAQQGGGDVFDIARCCREIEEGDTDSWERAWVALAERIEGLARAALADGRTATATKYFFHANQYWRMADVFLGEDRAADRAERFSRAQACFREAAKLHSPRIEVIEIACGAETYDGYFCHPVDPAPGAKWPAVFFIGGADAYAEEIFFSGRQMLERGIAMLLVDTPGRGSSMYLKGIPTRPDYEVPGMAVIDWLVARPEIDPERVGLMGISMAGYYAPRIAAFDKRVKALIAWCGCYSLLDDIYLFYDGLKPTLRRLPGGVGHEQALELLEAYSMAGLAGNIACPTLINHPRPDRLMDVRGAERLFAEIGASDKTLKIYDDPKLGGIAHCAHDAWAHNVPLMLDWLEARL